MKFVYTPEGLEPREWEFEPAKLMSPECIAIEKLTGLTFAEWADAAKRGSVQATHAYLWVLLKRDEPTLTPKQVQFSPSEVDFQPSDDEIRMVFEKFNETPADEWDDDDLAAIAELRATYPHLIPAPVDVEPDDDFGPDALDDSPSEVVPVPKDQA